jgi:membrane protein
MYVNTRQLKKIQYARTIFYFWKRRIARSQINQVAASLAYTTVLALVPMLSIATILVGQLPQFINLREAIQGWLTATLIPGVLSQRVSLYLLQFSNHSKGLTLFGVAGLFISAFLTLMTIEKSFNQVWQVKVKRSFIHKILFYSLVTALGPIFLGLSIYLTSLIMTATHNLDFGLSIQWNIIDIFYHSF